jgi:hypothetical protein
VLQSVSQTLVRRPTQVSGASATDASLQARLSGNCATHLFVRDCGGVWRGQCGCGGAAALLGGDSGDQVAVELDEVVGRGDEPPFRPAGRSPAALEASHLAVELQLAEDGFDRRLALAVERAAIRGREHASHEVIKAAGPSRARASAQAGVRCDEHLDAVADDRLDLSLCQ